jgi:hypothetical protein
MKSMKTAIRILNNLTSLGYLIITSAFAAGAGNSNIDISSINYTKDITFSDIYNLGWEVAEMINLLFIFAMTCVNLFLRQKFKKDKITIVYSLFCVILSLSLFILKLVYVNVSSVFLGSNVKVAIGFLRMFILYNSVSFFFI